MRPINSAFDRMISEAAHRSAPLVARLRRGETLSYDAAAEIDDVTWASVVRLEGFEEVAGEGYRLREVYA